MRFILSIPFAAAFSLSAAAADLDAPGTPDPSAPMWRLMAIELDAAHAAKADAAACLAKSPPPSEACLPTVVRFMDSLDALYSSLGALKVDAARVSAARTAVHASDTGI